MSAVSTRYHATARFVVAVFLADTSIGVWEFKNRNSGHTEVTGPAEYMCCMCRLRAELLRFLAGQGKFANKARRKNPMTRMWLEPRISRTDKIYNYNVCLQVACLFPMLTRCNARFRQSDFFVGATIEVLA